MQGFHGKIINALASPPTPPTPPAPITTASPRDATAPVTLSGADISAGHNKTDATVHAGGIRICILGLCFGGSPDDKGKDDGDETKPKRKYIHHKQRKFLREIAKRTPLNIDGETGCPIPSMATDSDGKS